MGEQGQQIREIINNTDETGKIDSQLSQKLDKMKLDLMSPLRYHRVLISPRNCATIQEGECHR